jgi:hypothetical protein
VCVEFKGWDATIVSLKLQSQYEKLDDDELLRLASDRTSLIDEAAAALDAEMRNRGLTTEDVTKYQHRLKRVEKLEARRRNKKIFGSKRDRKSWVENWVGVFWSVVIIALISMAYLALPSQYRFSPTWQETAFNVTFGAVFLVVFSKEWRTKSWFWISLFVSCAAQAWIVHEWIVRSGGTLDRKSRGDQKLAVSLGVIIFLVIVGCGAVVRHKFRPKSGEDID